jgi:DNA-binding response OmpR family regulator
MAIDSQRAPHAQQGLADDTWPGRVLFARGVLTPLQAERLGVRDGRSLWAAAVADGGLDGQGLLEELRAQVRTACLPVIVLTAQHGETEEKALDLGAHDYLGKPVQTRSLLARVRAVLKRASS